MRRFRPEQALLYVELRGGEGMSDVVTSLEKAGGSGRSIGFEEAEGHRRLALDVLFPVGGWDTALVKLSQIQHVTGARWSL